MLVRPQSPVSGARGGSLAARRLLRVLAGSEAGADSCIRMPGEEEQAFLAVRKELVSALRRDSGQTFSLEQLRPLLVTSLPPAARYLQLDATRLVRCNARGEVRPGSPNPAGEEDIGGPEARDRLIGLLSLPAPKLPQYSVHGPEYPGEIWPQPPQPSAAAILAWGQV